MLKGVKGMNMQRLPLTIVLLFAVNVPVSIAVGAMQLTGTVQNPTNCEDNISILSDAHHKAGDTGLIIAVARLGDGEKSQSLNHRRLHNIRVYLTEFDWHRAPETIIIAEGERVKGYGRIELYVGGKLFSVLPIKRNRDLAVGSCQYGEYRPVEAERNLYPYLDRSLKRR